MSYSLSNSRKAAVLEKNDDDVVIVSAIRTALTKVNQLFSFLHTSLNRAFFFFFYYFSVTLFSLIIQLSPSSNPGRKRWLQRYLPRRIPRCSLQSGVDSCQPRSCSHRSHLPPHRLSYC